MIEPKPDIDPADIDQWKKLNARWKDSQRKLEKALRDLQRQWELSESDMSGLTAVLSRIKVDRVQVLTNEQFGVAKRTPEYIEDCEKLREAAAVISRQFDYFKQFMPVNYAFREAYYEQTDLQLKGASQVATQRGWEALRDRFHSDAVLIGKLAAQAKGKLKQGGKSPSQTSEEWKDESFGRLFALLGHVFPGSKAKRTQLAVDLWNVYFGDEFYLNEELVPKILGRLSIAKKCKSQGNQA